MTYRFERHATGCRVGATHASPLPKMARSCPRARIALGLQKGRRAGVGFKGRGDIGVRFDLSTSSRHRRLNELRGEAGKVLEPVEGREVLSPLPPVPEPVEGRERVRVRMDGEERPLGRSDVIRSPKGENVPVRSWWPVREVGRTLSLALPQRGRGRNRSALHKGVYASLFFVFAEGSYATLLPSSPLRMQMSLLPDSRFHGNDDRVESSNMQFSFFCVAPFISSW